MNRKVLIVESPIVPARLFVHISPLGLNHDIGGPLRWEQLGHPIRPHKAEMSPVVHKGPSLAFTWPKVGLAIGLRIGPLGLLEKTIFRGRNPTPLILKMRMDKDIGHDKTPQNLTIELTAINRNKTKESTTKKKGCTFNRSRSHHENDCHGSPVIILLTSLPSPSIFPIPTSVKENLQVRKPELPSHFFFHH